MNTPTSPVTECASQLDRMAREHPTRALLIVIGCGLAAGLLVRTFHPRAAESRTARLLADLQERLHGIAAPVQRHTQDLVESGTDAVKTGVAHFHDLHLDRGLRKLGQRLTSLFR